MVVFQRTPNFSLPARNEPLAPATQAEVKADYRALRDTRFSQLLLRHRGVAPTEMAMEVEPDERQRRYEAAWGRGGLMSVTTTFRDLILDKAANDTAADFIRSKISELVDDPEVAGPHADRPSFATKRPCLDTGYFETFNRDNVTLVDLRQTPITEIVPSGIRTTAGVHELDCIVFATGFDAMTGPLLRRHPGPGEPATERQVVRRPPDVPGDRDRWVPQPLHPHGTGKPVGPQQHGHGHRAARGLDRRLPSFMAANELDHHRGHRRRRGRGSTTSTSSRMPRCSRGPTPGTWVPTCPASRASSALRRRLPAVSLHL